MPLEVHSPYEPRGDQPRAIDGIVEGLGDGLRFQTLLGVTGSGKSVGRAEPVTVDMGAEGTYHGPIGNLVDGALGHTAEVAETVEGAPPGPWKVLAWNPDDGTVGWREVRALSRHRAPEIMYELATRCGRRVSVTGDHSVWVLREGSLQLLQGSQVRPGDALPLPEKVPEPDRPITQLDLLDYLSTSTGTFADVRKVMDRMEAEELADWIGRHNPRPYGKLYAMRQGLKGHSVGLSAAAELVERGHLASEDIEIPGRRYSRGASLDLDEASLGLLGLYIAEGHAADRYAMLSVREPQLQRMVAGWLDDLDIHFFRTRDGDFVIGTRMWRDVFAAMLGTHAPNKRLPAFWASLGNRHLAALLRAYFEGDGGMEAGSVTAVTASSTLASEITEALLRFEIWARNRRVRKRRPDGTMGTYYRITISGAENLAHFAIAIGFLSERKRAAMLAWRKNVDTNVDLVYGVGERLRAAREARGLLQREVAHRAGVTRSMVSLVEHNRRSPSKLVFGRLCRALEIDDATFKGLAHVRWSQVASVDVIPPDGAYVYDLSVDGFETFMTGRGGLFVHNTYSMAKIIERAQRPALIMAPNKILTAQLASEFRDLFPTAAVEFFISYYDYYQPEAYVPARDLFIEKDANINMELERLRHSTTRSLLTRKDVIVVASVSAIYGLGSPEEYQRMHLILEVGGSVGRDAILETLVTQQYERNDIELAPGRFRARGDVIEVWAAYEEQPLRIELWGDEVDRLTMVDPITGDETSELETAMIFPARHYVTPYEKLEPAIAQMETDLQERLALFEKAGKLVEMQRLRERTLYDLEMLRTLGYCSGIENYSRYLEGRKPGEPPNTLLDYFPDDFITFLDESHVMLPQIRGMFNGDRARKQTLVDYGFRLPAALDNRPLKEEEFFGRVGQAVFVSATPADQEARLSDKTVEQVIRPTGLVDPMLSVKPSRGQIDDLMFAVRERAKRKERVLVTTLTKKMAEDLTEYLAEQGIRVRYMHSDIDAVERQVIIRDLRLGHFDVLVGINLLREGLDLPEVSLVAILDADKTGFLRSERSLIQTIGRAARNVNGEVFLYADEVSEAMRAAIDETNRRRDKQLAFNREHGITPETIRKRIHEVIRGEEAEPQKAERLDPWERELLFDDLKQELAQLETEMWKASEDLDFERAAAIRDRIHEIEARLEGKKVDVPTIPGRGQRARA